MPSSQFFNLPREKQEQILTASLREFAERGYDSASTNKIVEEAGISKGVLFKYFDNKESLFLYLADSVLRDMLNFFSPVATDDLFELLKVYTMQKILFSRERPLTYQFFVRVAKEPAHPVYGLVWSRAMEVSQTFMAQVVERLPDEVLREGVTWERVLSAITWIAEGLQHRYMSSVPDTVDDGFEEQYEPLMREMELYFNLLKHGIYREAQNP